MIAGKNGVRVLFIAQDRKETAGMAGVLRSAGHVVSVVGDLETARELLDSQGFDKAMVPAALLNSVLERLDSWDSSSQQTWTQATIALFYDLGNALRSLSRCLSELEDESARSDAHNERIEAAARRATTLLAFIDEMRQEMTATEQVRPTTFDLEDAIDASAITVYPIASDKRIRFVTELEPGLTEIRADQTMLKRVLANLLRFGVENSPVGGTVAVRSWRDGNHCVISMADGGEGISNHDLRRLFSPLPEPDAPEGIGLAGAKRAVERYGGRIWVESEKGAGTTLFISIPDQPHLAQPAGRTGVQAD